MLVADGGWTLVAGPLDTANFDLRPRQDLVRVVKQMAEDGRIAVRNLRRSARQDLDALEKDKEISSDDKERFTKDLDGYTQKAVDEIDRALAAKEQELLEV